MNIESPALSYQSEHYPASWRGKVPKRVNIVITVHPDFSFLCAEHTVAHGGEDYDVTVNSHGAVSAILPNGERLGLKPYEFEVVEWHDLPHTNRNK
jgi:hypothetical protein